MIRSPRVCMLVRNDCRTDYRVIKEAGALAQAGYDVTVVGVHTYGPGEEETRDGFTIQRVPVEPALTPPGKALNLFPRALTRMAAAAARLHADIYHAHDADAILPAWLATRRVPHAKLVYDAHEVGFYNFRESLTGFPFRLPLITWFWSKWNDRIVHKYVDAVITVNDALADIQAEHYDIPRPVVVMNCPPRFTPDPQQSDRLARTVGVSPDTPIIVCQGMFTPERGDGPPLEQVVRAAGLLHKGVIVFIGNLAVAPQFQWLRDLAQQPPQAGRVFFLPPVPPAELLAYTIGGQIGLIPVQLSGFQRFHSPNKLFEYAAAGLPTIVPDLPIIRQIAETYDFGVLCDFSSAEAIAAAINDLLGNPGRYAVMRQGALAAAEVYNWENQSVTLRDLYARLVADS